MPVTNFNFPVEHGYSVRTCIVLRERHNRDLKSGVLDRFYGNSVFMIVGVNIDKTYTLVCMRRGYGVGHVNDAFTDPVAFVDENFLSTARPDSEETGLGHRSDLRVD